MCAPLNPDTPGYIRFGELILGGYNKPLVLWRWFRFLDFVE
jgi:hypothetical protein